MGFTSIQITVKCSQFLIWDQTAQHHVRKSTLRSSGRFVTCQYMRRGIIKHPTSAFCGCIFAVCCYPPPPLWSSVHNSWLQIQRPGFDSWSYQIFWEVVGLERGPLSLVSTTEELLGRKSSGSGIENRDYGRRDPLSWPRDTLSARVSLGRYSSLAD
jgi:hypothetical protein